MLRAVKSAELSTQNQTNKAFWLHVVLVCWNVVVAVEFELFEGSGDPEPAGHGGGFDTGDASFADDDDIAAAHGPADENDFKFDCCVESEFARAQEKDSRRADVAGDQRDGEIFRVAGYAAKTKGKAQGCSGIFAQFGKDSNGVSRHASKTAHWIDRLERHDAKRRHTRSHGRWLRGCDSGAVPDCDGHRDGQRRNGDRSQGDRLRRLGQKFFRVVVPQSLVVCTHVAPRCYRSAEWPNG